MSSPSITDFFPQCCALLQIVSTEANKMLENCEKDRASFFSVVVLYKIKIDSIKKIKEDKLINFNIDTNLEQDNTKISALFNSGVYFNYPFETNPPEVLDSLLSFSLTFEGIDKEDALTNLQALTDLLTQFKALDKAKNLEAYYSIFIHSEGLKNHLIVSLKVDDKYKDLIKKVKTVFPIDKYFLSFLSKVSMSYGIKLSEFNQVSNDKLIDLLKTPHLSCDLTIKNYEIVNELYVTYNKMMKMINKAEGIPEQKIQEESDWNITHLILFIQAFKSLSFDFKMLPSIEILKKMFDQYMEEDMMSIIMYKGLLAPFLNALKLKNETIEINCLVPLLMMRLNISLSCPGLLQFISK